MMNDPNKMFMEHMRQMFWPWTALYIRILLVYVIPIGALAVLFLSLPWLYAAPLSIAIAILSIWAGLRITIPDPPDFTDMFGGGGFGGDGMMPPGVPVESALRVPVPPKRKEPELPLPPL
jgi:hypothetical protein